MNVTAKNIGAITPNGFNLTNQTDQQIARNGIAEKVSKICLGTFAILAIASIQVADAGPIFGGWCLLACLPLIEAPPLLSVCLAACGMVGISPIP